MVVKFPMRQDTDSVKLVDTISNSWHISPKETIVCSGLMINYQHWHELPRDMGQLEEQPSLQSSSADEDGF
ncbi:hypothetical protein GOP47_0000520 [Adiantum capillus-veneris]|uniref:Uncharacterized protein n=1 Tax=Adiantum capillus-veneris TaxID=13818 RepID=A0A9D4VEW2_ADICA|nr:hypothetical protein GOP47_0000520 [Adiantum capillus-veneris]